jgi:hypothetical protein
MVLMDGKVSHEPLLQVHALMSNVIRPNHFPLSLIQTLGKWVKIGGPCDRVCGSH